MHPSLFYQSWALGSRGSWWTFDEVLWAVCHTDRRGNPHPGRIWRWHYGEMSLPVPTWCLSSQCSSFLPGRCSISVMLGTFFSG
jgi:hypothetical protein